MRNLILRLTVFCVLSVFCLLSRAGKLVVSGDNWPLSQRGFTEEPGSANAFVDHLEAFFTHRGSGQWLPGKAGRFLIYGGAGRDVLAQKLQDDGHVVEFFRLEPAAPSLNRLCQFDGVIIRPTPPFGVPPGFDFQSFIRYLQMGGNVYVEASGSGQSDRQANMLNGLLEPFGILLTGTQDGVVHENVRLNTTHPLFRGVEALHWHQGQGLEVTSRRGNTPIAGENGLTMFVVSSLPWRGSAPCAAVGRLPLPPIGLPPLPPPGLGVPRSQGVPPETTPHHTPAAPPP